MAVLADSNVALDAHKVVLGRTWSKIVGTINLKICTTKGKGFGGRLWPTDLQGLSLRESEHFSLQPTVEIDVYMHFRVSAAVF